MSSEGAKGRASICSVAHKAPFIPAKAGIQANAGSPLSRGRTEERISGHIEQIETHPRGLRWTVGTRFATGRSPCGAFAGGIPGA